MVVNKQAALLLIYEAPPPHYRSAVAWVLASLTRRSDKWPRLLTPRDSMRPPLPGRGAPSLPR